MEMPEPIRAVVRTRGDWFVANTYGGLGVSAVGKTVGNLTAALQSEIAKALKMPRFSDMPEVLLLDADGKPLLDEVSSQP